MGEQINYGSLFSHIGRRKKYRQKTKMHGLQRVHINFAEACQNQKPGNVTLHKGTVFAVQTIRYLFSH